MSRGGMCHDTHSPSQRERERERGEGTCERGGDERCSKLEEVRAGR